MHRSRHRVVVIAIVAVFVVVGAFVAGNYHRAIAGPTPVTNIADVKVALCDLPGFLANLPRGATLITVLPAEATTEPVEYCTCGPLKCDVADGWVLRSVHVIYVNPEP